MNARSILNIVAVFFACLLAFSGSLLRAQLIPVPLAERFANAQLVVEGEVVSSRRYYGENRNIYSSHVISVTKRMKGVCADTLEVVLAGGIVGDDMDLISHHLYLGDGQRGVFLLVPHHYLQPRLVHNGTPAYNVFADLQGFIHYKEQLGATVASEPFHCYRSIEQDLYSLLGWWQGGAPALHRLVPEHGLGGPAIDSIRPLVASAGTRTEISIHGSGFLDAKGKVFFLNASDGGATRIPTDSTDIQEWSDTLIRTWVPSVNPLPPPIEGPAGTGTVTVENTDGDFAESQDILQIPFAVANRRSFQTGLARYVSLINQDSLAGADTSGGYTLHLSTSFGANTGAAIAFRKAIRTWRCATGVNFKVGADTAYDAVANDTLCIVKWDDGPDSLPPGVLGLTITRIRPCLDATEQGYFLQEVEFVFSRNQNWYFDTLLTDPTKWDFNSAALHEIGHGHLLFHVIDGADLMNWALNIGAITRVVTVSAQAGGGWIMDSSVVAHGSCPAPMTAVLPGDCNMLAVEQPELPMPIVLLSPNPSAGNFRIHLDGVYSKYRPTITLLDGLGRELDMSKYVLQDLGDGEVQAICDGIPDGLYFVRVEVRNRVVHKKTILVK